MASAARKGTERNRSSDPWSRFVARSEERSGSCFYFERGESPGRTSRYALSGFDPDDRMVWSDASDVRDSLRAARAGCRSRKTGGWFSIVGFDAVGLFEPLLAPSAPRSCPFPAAVFDHYRSLERAPVPPPRARHPPAALPEGARLGPSVDTASRTTFGRSVDRLREAIYDGEAFQVVLAHRRTRTRRGSLLPAVDLLRRRERFAYLYYARVEDGGRSDGLPLEVFGASPESVVEVRGRHVAVNPIAGTRPRPPPTRGRYARLPLDKDPKELAEHRMLVDLARNDLGRVSEIGSVRLTRRETRVPYARLEHLVSRVVGRLAPGTGALEALLAAFPAGTVSGAPKIRATELLRREERTWRGPYAGAVGVLTDRGEGDFALAIRGGFASPTQVHTQAGAGIVHLSQPEREWLETLTKLSMVERALTGGEAISARERGAQARRRSRS